MRKGLVMLLAWCMLMFMAVPVSAAIFSDIEGHWAQGVIEEVAEKGLVSGMDDGTFQPEQAVTRAQAVVVLGQLFELSFELSNEGQETPDFVEHPITRLELAQAISGCLVMQEPNIPMTLQLPAFFDTDELTPEEMNSVIMMNNMNIMQGYEGYFRPQDQLTRAELAQVVSNFQQESDMITEAPKPLEIITESIHEEDESLVIDVNLPVLQGGPNVVVQTLLNDMWKDEIEKRIQEVRASLSEVETPNAPYSVASKFLGQIAGDHLSLYVDYYWYTGGAHGMTDRVAYNYDLNTGQPIALADLFPTDYDYRAMIDSVINAEILAEPDKYFSGDEMGFKGIAADQQYYIQGENLVIYFGLYEIAPYAVGIPEFVIPLNNI